MTPPFDSSSTDWLDDLETEASLMHDELQPHALSLRASITVFFSSLVDQVGVTSETTRNRIDIH